MSSPTKAPRLCPCAFLELFAVLFSNNWIEQWQQQRREKERLELLEDISKKPAPGFYRRIFALNVTLWYLIYQRLNSDLTLAAVMIDLRAGGADRLGRRGGGKLSTKIRSPLTSAYNQARQRLPLELLQEALIHMGSTLFRKITGAKSGARGKPGVHQRQRQLLDGSTLSILATPELSKEFPSASNQNGASDWCMMRIVVGFCARSGVVLSAVAASVKRGEQVLTWGIMAKAEAFIIWIGDRNFGVWSVTAQAVRYNQDVLVRMSKVRAAKLWKGRPMQSGEDRPVQWQPSRWDQVPPGAERLACAGRLIYIRLCKEGKWIDLWLFTTLDAEDYPLELLVKWYGQRWQAELNFRSIKTQMKLAELDVNTPAMAQKEFYAGLLAYSLVRSVMWAAGERLEVRVEILSFNQARSILRSRLEIWMRGGQARVQSAEKWVESLLDEIALHTLPKRRNSRPTELRRVRHKRQKFPPLKGSRTAARARELTLKSA
jgi:hypothetical protein